MNPLEKHLTQKAAGWFDNVDAWRSFVELIPLQSQIEKVWLDTATESLRLHFARCSCPGWQFKEWGSSHDTWWFLEEFGAESVGLGFGWRYYFCFGVAMGSRIDRAALKKALEQEDYRPLLGAFGVTGPSIHGLALEQYGGFTFGSPLDGYLPAHELAWFAGNETDSFVEQAAAKIEAFARNHEITALLRQLNQELMDLPAGGTPRA